MTFSLNNLEKNELFNGGERLEDFPQYGLGGVFYDTQLATEGHSDLTT